MWSLETPIYLLLLPVIGFLFYIVHIRKNRGAQVRFSFKIWRKEGFTARTTLVRVVITFSRTVFWTGFLSLILAAAGPARVARQQIFLSKGIDIVIALDESPSMSAQDFQPVNRFESARDVIRRFIRRRENDQIGLVSFASEAALRAPPTVDYDSLIEILDNLHIMELGDGTAIGMGIAVAVLHLRSSKVNSKVLILMTDGDNNAGEILPETASEIAAQLGITIYTIGLGKEGDTFLEFVDPKTKKTYKGFYRGRFNEGLLKRISSVAGGKYFYAGDPGTLQAVFDEIDAIEKTEIRRRWVVTQVPKHTSFIFFGLSCIIFDFFVRKGLIQEWL